MNTNLNISLLIILIKNKLFKIKYYKNMIKYFLKSDIINY